MTGQRFGLSAATIDKIQGVLERHPVVQRAVIYGSRAKGNYRPGSDIDLTLFAADGQSISYRELGDILDEVDDLLLPYTLDLSAFEQLNHDQLREHIERVGQVFYERRGTGDHPGVAVKKGWQLKALGDVCEMYQPKTISGKDMVEGGAYPVYGANGVIGRYNQFNHEEPQLLITCRGATCGSVNISAPRSWVTGNAMVVRPKNESLKMRYLEYLFRGGIDISKAITGAAQPQITRTNLEPLEISFPESLGEQERIVAILDEAFEGIATAKANTEKNLQNARAVFESHLNAVFSQRGEGWVERRIGDESLLQIIDGDRGKNYPQSADFNDNGHCLFLNTKNVRPDGFEFETTMFITAEKDGQLRKGKLERDDVVLTTRETIGNIGLYDEDVPYDHIRINSGMLILRTNKHAMMPSYLFELLRSGIVKEQIRKKTTGAAQPQLPIKTLVDFTIPVPKNLDDQSAMVTKLRAIKPETQRLESIYQRKLTALDELKKSLLHQAFSGEL